MSKTKINPQAITPELGGVFIINVTDSFVEDAKRQEQYVQLQSMYASGLVPLIITYDVTFGYGMPEIVHVDETFISIHQTSVMSGKLTDRLYKLKSDGTCALTKTNYLLTAE